MDTLTRRDFLRIAAGAAGALAGGEIAKKMAQPDIIPWLHPQFGSLTDTAKEILGKRTMVVRPQGVWNPETQDGWRQEDLESVQNILDEAEWAVETFFGRSFFIVGSIPIYHLGPNETSNLNALVGADVNAASNWAGNLLSDEFIRKYQVKVKPQNFTIAICYPYFDKQSGLLTQGKKEALKIYSGHEMAHGAFNIIEIPPFNIHEAINLAIYADYLRRGATDNLDVNLKSVMPSGLELYCWQMYRGATGGKEFFKELMERLLAEYGRTSPVFSESQVVAVVESMFSEVNMPTFETLRKNFK